jgi:hypothetical protein
VQFKRLWVIGEPDLEHGQGLVLQGLVLQRLDEMLDDPIAGQLEPGRPDVVVRLIDCSSTEMNFSVCVAGCALARAGTASAPLPIRAAAPTAAMDVRSFIMAPPSCEALPASFCSGTANARNSGGAKSSCARVILGDGWSVLRTTVKHGTVQNADYEFQPL